jgi:hypothetical protein
MKTAALHACGAFITAFIPSTMNLRVKGPSNIKTEGNNTFQVTGSVEGFSSYNECPI